VVLGSPAARTERAQARLLRTMSGSSSFLRGMPGGFLRGPKPRGEKKKEKKNESEVSGPEVSGPEVSGPENGTVVSGEEKKDAQNFSWQTILVPAVVRQLGEIKPGSHPPDAMAMLGNAAQLDAIMMQVRGQEDSVSKRETIECLEHVMSGYEKYLGTVFQSRVGRAARRRPPPPFS